MQSYVYLAKLTQTNVQSAQACSGCRAHFLAAVFKEQLPVPTSLTFLRRFLTLLFSGLNGPLTLALL